MSLTLVDIPCYDRYPLETHNLWPTPRDIDAFLLLIMLISPSNHLINNICCKSLGINLVSLLGTQIQKQIHQFISGTKQSCSKI